MTTRNEAAERLRGRVAHLLLVRADRHGTESGAIVLDEALAAAKAEGAREPLALLRELAAFPFQPVLPEGKALIRKLRSFVQDERESSLGRDAEGHLVLTLGPGAESPSRKGERADLKGLSPLEAWNEDANR